MNTPEPDSIYPFRAWLKRHGAYIHPSLRFIQAQDGSGMTVHTVEALPPDTTILTCPFSLAITPDSARKALRAAAGDLLDTRFDQLNDRQVMCAYMILHRICPQYDSLIHGPYLNTLPSNLLTPMYFNEHEMQLLKGTNMIGAVKDRTNQWSRELRACYEVFRRISGFQWGFSWQEYGRFATYITSRAFPSTLLSVEAPSTSSLDAVPVLIPGIDCLNHKRAHAVSWVASPTLRVGDVLHNEPCITLVHHPPLAAGKEVFNNYGPKPNDELLLGYGFTLENNPDDTMALLPRGGPRVIVQRDAVGIEQLWANIRTRFDEGVEGDIHTAESIAWMLDQKLDQLLSMDQINELKTDRVRPTVAEMIVHYVQGQRDILNGMIDFVEDVRKEKIQQAAAEGIIIDDYGDDQDELESEDGDALDEK